MRNLLYITRTDMSSAPYPEVTLPALARSGWNILVVGPDPDDSIYRKNLPYPCQTLQLPKGSIAKELRIFSLLQRGRFGKFDAIYINSQSMSARAAFALAGPRFGKKLIYHTADYYCPIRYPVRAKLEKKLCKMADLYINVEFHRGYITSTMYKRKGPTLIAPPNLPKAWPIPQTDPRIRNLMAGNDPEAFVLMLHGGYSPIRMVPQLLTALTLLPPRFRLVMTGKSNTPDGFDSLLEKMQLSSRVLRLPRADMNEMFTYTVNADAGVLLYQNSDLGNFFQAPGRFTEYLACGLPLLSANFTGLENLILRYDLGQTTNPADPGEIARTLTRLEAAARQSRYTRQRIRTLFESHFAFDHWEPFLIDAVEAMMRGERSTDSKPTFPWLPVP